MRQTTDFLIPNTTTGFYRLLRPCIFNEFNTGVLPEVSCRVSCTRRRSAPSCSPSVQQAGLFSPPLSAAGQSGSRIAGRHQHQQQSQRGARQHSPPNLRKLRSSEVDGTIGKSYIMLNNVGFLWQRNFLKEGNILYDRGLYFTFYPLPPPPSLWGTK